MADLQVVLSVIVIIASDTTRSRYDTAHLAGTLEALAHQAGAPPLEIIVPYAAPLEGIAELERRYPNVRFLPIRDLASYRARTPGHKHHEELRARGLALATGRIAGLLEDHDRPDPQWAAAMIAAHRQPYAGIGGAIENGVDRPLNWAVYFCDFARYQNPLPSGASRYASDANSSYKRAALESVRPLWTHFFNELIVNSALLARGAQLGLARGAVAWQYRLNLRFGDALRERFIWGRSYAATRSLFLSPAQRMAYAALSPLLVPLLVWRVVQTVAAKGRTLAWLLQSLPLLVPLETAWAAGECAGYLHGRAASQPAAVRTAGSAS